MYRWLGGGFILLLFFIRPSDASVCVPGTYNLNGVCAQCPENYACPTEIIFKNRYRWVEYIESDGNQYIDLDYRPNNNTTVETELMQTDDRAVNKFATMVYGVRHNNVSFMAGKASYNSAYVFVYWNRDLSQTDVVANHNRVIIKHSADFSVESVDTGYVYSKSFARRTEFLIPDTMILFGYKDDDIVKPSKVRFYYFKLSENENLIMDLIPVYDTISEQYGMYDKITEHFYENMGTGDFLGGNAVDIISCSDATNGIAPYSPAGSDEYSDCGRVLHFGGNLLYLRSSKRTMPSLNVRIGDNIFYGDMVSDTNRGHLRINLDGTVYSVFNADVD